MNWRWWRKSVWFLRADCEQKPWKLRKTSWLIWNSVWSSLLLFYQFLDSMAGNTIRTSSKLLWTLVLYVIKKSNQHSLKTQMISYPSNLEKKISTNWNGVSGRNNNMDSCLKSLRQLKLMFFLRVFCQSAQTWLYTKMQPKKAFFIRLRNNNPL